VACALMGGDRQPLARSGWSIAGSEGFEIDPHHNHEECIEWQLGHLQLDCVVTIMHISGKLTQ